MSFFLMFHMIFIGWVLARSRVAFTGRLLLRIYLYFLAVCVALGLLIYFNNCSVWPHLPLEFWLQMGFSEIPAEAIGRCGTGE